MFPLDTRENHIQSINQSIDRTTEQSTDQSTDQSINQSMNRTINQSTKQSTDQSINQPIKQSTDQSINQLTVGLMNQTLPTWRMVWIPKRIRMATNTYWIVWICGISNRSLQIKEKMPKFWVMAPALLRKWHVQIGNKITYVKTDARGWNSFLVSWPFFWESLGVARAVEDESRPKPSGLLSVASIMKLSKTFDNSSSICDIYSDFKVCKGKKQKQVPINPFPSQNQLNAIKYRFWILKLKKKTFL